MLYQKGLLLAKLETTFRTDSSPVETIGAFDFVDADVTVGTDVIAETGHGFQTADGPVMLTNVGGALPTGLAVDTNYWIIRVDADNIKLAATRALAIAGTAVDITAAAGSGTHTLTFRRSDAFLVIDPDFDPNLTVVERENVTPHLSPDPIIVARKYATITFQHEVRGNGVITDPLLAPELGTLLRGCGYAETEYGESGSETETILNDTPIPVNGPTGVFTYTKTTAYGGTLPRTVIMVCTTGGGSGAAVFSIFSPAVGNQAEVYLTAQGMTEDTAFQLVDDTPAADAEITVAVGGITTSFVAGDTYVFQLAPAGHYYEPISASFESLTLYLYFDGVLHQLTGAMGTFTIEGTGGGFATLSFTFTGDYVDPTDVALPSSPVYVTDGGDAIIPPQVELANLYAMGGQDGDSTSAVTMARDFNRCAEAFSVDGANNVVPRTCINAADANAGSQLTNRGPTAGFNPEAELEATHPFWSLLSDGTRVVWGLRVGSVQGNVLAIQAPYAQYSELGYGNRDEIRTYDVNIRLSTPTGAGNDELRLVFC